jgi:hypothetical protein
MLPLSALFGQLLPKMPNADSAFGRSGTDERNPERGIMRLHVHARAPFCADEVFPFADEVQRWVGAADFKLDLPIP